MLRPSSAETRRQFPRPLGLMDQISDLVRTSLRQGCRDVARSSVASHVCESVARSMVSPLSGFLVISSTLFECDVSFDTFVGMLVVSPAAHREA